MLLNDAIPHYQTMFQIQSRTENCKSVSIYLCQCQGVLLFLYDYRFQQQQHQRQSKTYIVKAITEDDETVLDLRIDGIRRVFVGGFDFDDLGPSGDCLGDGDGVHILLELGRIVVDVFQCDVH